MLKQTERSEWCSHPETIGCELFLPPFGVSIYFHGFRPPVRTWERWLGYQLTVFQLGERRFSWEVIWSFVHISKVLWSPKLPWRNFLLYFWFFGPFSRPLSFLSLRTAFVPFLNLFLYIQRNNFQENCEILLPFCFQYVCDLRSLKEKKIYDWIWPASA